MLLVTSLPVFASPRVALVIGNSAYRQDRLNNPVNDAAGIASELCRLGLSLIEKTDTDLRAMLDAMDPFFMGRYEVTQVLSINNMTFLHLIFRPSLAAVQPRNPRCSAAMPAVSLNHRDQI